MAIALKYMYIGCLSSHLELYFRIYHLHVDALVFSDTVTESSLYQYWKKTTVDTIQKLEISLPISLKYTYWTAILIEGRRESN